MKCHTLAVVSLITLPVSEAFWVSKPTDKVIVWHYKDHLLETVTDQPGWHVYNPLTTNYQLVDVESQTDTFGPIECRSKDRQLVIFPKIMVTNQLPKERVYIILSHFEKYREKIFYDKVLIERPIQNWVLEQCTKFTGDELQSTKFPMLNEQLREHLIEFQTKHSDFIGENETGIKFPELGVIIWQPRLDSQVEKERQKVAQFKAEQLAEEAERNVAVEREQTARVKILMKAESERQQANVENMKLIEASESEAKRMKIEKESQAEQAKISAESEADTIRKIAEANKYASVLQSESNQALYGSQEAYVEVLRFQSITNGTKIYWGEKLPQYISAPPFSEK